MPDVKVSGLPNDTSLDGNHYVVLNDPTGPTTKRSLLSVLAAFFFNQVNIPDGSGSPRTRDSEMMFDHVASGCVWSADAAGSTRNASLSSGFVYINGRRLPVSSVSARSFTASKDTYVDILDNGDGTSTTVYTEVSNNAASPSLAANSMRIGIIVTGASNIATAASINQGQEDRILPIASSIAYTVTDSIGNLICPRDPNRKLLGYRQQLTTFTTTSATYVAVTGLTVPVIVPTGRKVKVTFGGRSWSVTGGNIYALSGLFDGSVAGSQISESVILSTTSSQEFPMYMERVATPSTNSKTYVAGLRSNTAGQTASVTSGTGIPSYIKVELE